jgi:hypothetical protein
MKKICLGFLCWTLIVPRVAAAADGAMLIDTSGSMNKSDQARLRWDGILTFIQLLSLSQSNGLSLHYFMDKDVVRVPHTLLRPETFRGIEQVAREVYPDNGQTDLGPSLEAAMQELSQHRGTRYMIIVSDGQLNCGNAARREKAALAFVRAGGKIFFICLGPQGFGGAHPLIKHVADLSGGVSYEILRPDKRKVLEVFLDIFTRVAPPSLAHLTLADGRFALNRSNRSFLALDPMGHLLTVRRPDGAPVENSQTRPFRARDIGFKGQWNVVVCERPALDELGGNWESDQWQVRDENGRLPLAGVHIFVHSDVAFLDAPAAGLRLQEGAGGAVSASLSAGSVAEWFAGTDLDFLKDAIVGVEVIDAANNTAARGDLTFQGAGRFAGSVVGRLDRGRYRSLLTAVHRVYKTGLLARSADVPVSVGPLPYSQNVSFRASPDEAPAAVSYDADGNPLTQLFSGSQVQYRLRVNSQLLSAPKGTALDSVRLQARLKLRVAGDSQPIVRDFQFQQGGTNSVYQTDWFELTTPGKYEGTIEIEGSVRFVQSGQFGTPVFGECAFSNTLPANALRVRAGEVLCEWDDTPATIGCDETLVWSGRVRSRGAAAQTQALFHALLAGGLAVEVVDGSGTASHSSQQRDAFEMLRVQSVADAVVFSGRFVGNKTQGTQLLRVRLAAKGKEIECSGAERTVTVAGNILCVTVRATDGGSTRAVLESGCGRAAQGATILPNQEVSIAARLSAQSGAALESLVLTLSRGGETVPLAVTAQGREAVARPVKLPVGNYDLRAEALLAGGSVARQAMSFTVSAEPLTVIWEAPPTAVFCDQEAPFAGHVEIVASAAEARDYQQAIRSGGLRFEIEIGGRRFDSRTNAELFRFERPPDTPAGPAFKCWFTGPKTPGELLCRARLDSGGRTLPLAHDIMQMAVSGNWAEVRLTARRGSGAARQIFQSSAGTAGAAVALFTDQELIVEFGPAEALPNVSQYLLWPELTLVSAGQRLQIPIGVTNLYCTKQLPALAAGSHDLRMILRVTPELSVQHRLSLAVQPVPAAELAWITQPAAAYLQGEQANLQARVSFSAGTGADWQDWLRAKQLRLALVEPGKAGEWFPTTLSLVGPQSNGLAFSGDVPTGRAGEQKLKLSLLRGNEPASAPLLKDVRLDPFMVFEVMQKGSTLADSRSGVTRRGHPGEPCVVRARVEGDPKQLSKARLTVQQAGMNLLELDLHSSDGRCEKPLPPLTAGSYELKFFSEVVPGVSRKLVYLRQDLPLKLEWSRMEIFWEYARWLARALGLSVFGSLLLWWFYPGLVVALAEKQGALSLAATHVAPESLRGWRQWLHQRAKAYWLPKMSGELRRLFPRLGEPNSFAARTDWVYRLGHRGLRSPRVRFGKSGDHLLLDAESTAKLPGLSREAWVEFEFTRDKQTLQPELILRRRNPGSSLQFAVFAGAWPIVFTDQDKQVPLDGQLVWLNGAFIFQVKAIATPLSEIRITAPRPVPASKAAPALSASPTASQTSSHS